MPLWMIVALIVVGGFLLMALIGYFMRPQGNQQPVTTRDREFLQRRANFANSEMERWQFDDAVRLAEMVTKIARQKKAFSVKSDNEVLSEALCGMVVNPVLVSALTGELFGMVLGVLMEQGVLNDLDGPMSAYGITPQQVIYAPEVLVELVGVRNLEAWPKQS